MNKRFKAKRFICPICHTATDVKSSATTYRYCRCSICGTSYVIDKSTGLLYKTISKPISNQVCTI